MNEHNENIMELELEIMDKYQEQIDSITKRIQWLVTDKPKFDDGTPLSENDKTFLLIACKEELDKWEINIAEFFKESGIK